MSDHPWAEMNFPDVESLTTVGLLLPPVRVDIVILNYGL
jgi:hypothetical protein